jgi:CRISPR-associated protein Cmr4
MAASILTGIYTLTPAHCGTGQTSGAVDLPIAREPHTRFPVLPASGLKGAARSTLNEKEHADKELARRLFGPDVNAKEKGDETEALEAGSLVILEGRLLLYPLRSLQRPFLYATCPLILERLERDLRALAMGDSVLGKDWVVPRVSSRPGSDTSVPSALVTDKGLAGQTLVVEDLVYTGGEVGELPRGDALTKIFQRLLPDTEDATRERVAESLVVLPDCDFADVVQRVTPVQARIKLNDETKTTSGDGGNLWYEETLPPDCLFAVPVTKRAGYRKNEEPAGEFAALLKKIHGERHAIQIGGNETVGEGFCWWTAYGAGSTRGGEASRD